jgi:hypothetical protein
LEFDINGDAEAVHPHGGNHHGKLEPFWGEVKVEEDSK